MKLVLIEWVDSRQPTAAWERVRDLEHLVEGRCLSVGFLIRETKYAKILAASVADHDDDPQATGGIRHTHRCRAFSARYRFFDFGLFGTCVRSEAATFFTFGLGRRENGIVQKAGNGAAKRRVCERQ